MLNKKLLCLLAWTLTVVVSLSILPWFWCLSSWPYKAASVYFLTGDCSRVSHWYGCFWGSRDNFLSLLSSDFSVSLFCKYVFSRNFRISSSVLRLFSLFLQDCCSSRSNSIRSSAFIFLHKPMYSETRKALLFCPIISFYGFDSSLINFVWCFCFIGFHDGLHVVKCKTITIFYY